MKIQTLMPEGEVIPFLLQAHTEELLRNGVKSLCMECHPAREDSWHVVAIGEEETIIPIEVALGDILGSADDEKIGQMMMLIGFSCLGLISEDSNETVDLICKGFVAVMFDLPRVAHMLPFMKQSNTLQPTGSRLLN